MTEFLRKHPDLRPRDVLAAYLERLSPKTMEHSCINHSATGCGLQREMRSRICNHYACSSMKGWRARDRQAENVVGTFVVSRKLDNWTKPTADNDNRVVLTAVVTARDVDVIESHLVPTGRITVGNQVARAAQEAIDLER